MSPFLWLRGAFVLLTSQYDCLVGPWTAKVLLLWPDCAPCWMKQATYSRPFFRWFVNILQRKSRCQQSSHKAHNSHNSDSSCRSAFHFRCSLQHRQRYSWQQRTPSTGYMSHCCFCFEFRQAPSRRLERSFKIFQDLLDPLRGNMLRGIHEEIAEILVRHLQMIW